MGDGRLGKRLGIAGCLILAVLFVAVVVLIAFLAWRSARDHEAMADDTAARTAQALGILGADSLPEGARAVSTVRLGGFLQGVVLSDAAPDASGRIQGFERSLFLYLESRGGEVTLEDLVDLWPGRLRLETRGRLAEGSLSRPAGSGIDFAASGAVLALGHRRLEGVVTELVFRCRDSERSRVGLLFQALPEGEVDHRGSLARFTASMDPCTR